MNTADMKRVETHLKRTFNHGGIKVKARKVADRLAGHGGRGARAPRSRDRAPAYASSSVWMSMNPAMSRRVTMP